MARNRPIDAESRDLNTYKCLNTISSDKAENMGFIDYLNRINSWFNGFLISCESGKGYTLNDIKLNKRSYILCIIPFTPFIIMLIAPLTLIQSVNLSGSMSNLIGSIIIFSTKKETMITPDNWQIVEKRYDSKKYFGWCFVIIGNLLLFINQIL